MPSLHILVSVVIAMASPVLSYACPTNCHCRKAPISGTIVECRDQQLRSIPDNFPQDTVEIIFRKSSLPALTSASFTNLSQLKNLTFESCAIDKLNANAFSTLASLISLTLSSNEFYTLHQEAFKGNSPLKYLYFDHNRLLYSIPDFVFEGLNLVDLSLQSNQLHDFDKNTFVGAHVENLYLDGNTLNRLDAEDLEPLKSSLKSLSIKNNLRMLNLEKTLFQGFNMDSVKLSNSQIEDHSFLAYVNTISLDISGNPLRDLEFDSYINLSTIKELSAHNLKMDFLEDTTFSPFTQLEILNIAQNNIMLISSRVFQYMPDLKSLHMGSNLFMMLPDDLGRYLPKVHTLNIARCHLMTLTADSFEGMTNLTTLDLRYNKLQIIDQSMEKVFDKIGIVGLEGNPLHCNCEMLWYRKWLESQAANTMSYQCFSPQKISIMEMSIEQFRCIPPNITRFQAHIEAVVGDDVHLTCIAYGDPSPDIEWLPPSGGVIKISGSFNRTMLQTTGVMSIRQVDSSRTGAYICVASSSKGRVNVTTHVTVVMSPSLTSPLISTTQVPSTSHLLSTSITVTPNVSIISPNTTSNASMYSNFTQLITSTTVDSRNHSSTLPYMREKPFDYKYIIIAVILVVFFIIVITLLAIFISKRKKKMYDVKEADASIRVLPPPSKLVEETDVHDIKDEKQKLTTEL